MYALGLLLRPSATLKNAHIGKVLYGQALCTEKVTYTVVRSICTHFFGLSGPPNIFLGSGTLKNQVQNTDLKKAGFKKKGHCYSNRKETRLPLLFLNNNDPILLSLLFLGPYFGPDFFRVTNRPIFSKQE